MERRTKESFCLMWIKIFALIVIGGFVLGALSNLFFPQPAYAKLATMNIIEAKKVQPYATDIRKPVK